MELPVCVSHFTGQGGLMFDFNHALRTMIAATTLALILAASSLCVIAVLAVLA
jgi:hypothetical protein